MSKNKATGAKEHPHTALLEGFLKYWSAGHLVFSVLLSQTRALEYSYWGISISTFTVARKEFPALL